MSVRASIGFTQGVIISNPGDATIGSLGTAVIVRNGNNAGVQTWTFEVVDVPPDSSVVVGIAQSGSLPTFSFTPDTTGGYLIHLTVVDLFGNFSEDYRVFQVLELSGRLIPPFRATADALNFNSNSRGWAQYLEQYLRDIDARNVAVITSGYNMAGFDEIISVGAISAPILIRLPHLASVPPGRSFEVYDSLGNAGAHNITVDGNGSSIRGSSSYVISTNYGSGVFTHDGNIWLVR